MLASCGHTTLPGQVSLPELRQHDREPAGVPLAEVAEATPSTQQHASPGAQKLKASKSSMRS